MENVMGTQMAFQPLASVTQIHQMILIRSHRDKKTDDFVRARIKGTP